MGAGIAQVIAQGGHRVSLFDQSAAQLENGLKTIERQLDSFVKKAKIEEQVKLDTLERLTTISTLPNQIFDIVVEAVPENKSIKQAVFKDIGKISDNNTILATNTSSISISEKFPPLLKKVSR
jgi:3-hydroxybutyryl-CoA dehydrogenase